MGIPGTGLGYRRDVSMPQEGGEPSTPTRRHGGAWLIVGLLALALLAYLLAGCGFAEWRDHTLREVAEGRWHVDSEQVPPSSASSQSIEFYSPSGQHLGYGRIQGGTVEFFGVDGSRAGFGRLGR